MDLLTSLQRNALYLQEAERAGIHKPILAALYQVHNSPSLTDGETGLGISPVNRIALGQVNTFPQQVQYAASTIRSLITQRVVEGWKPADFWDTEKGHYGEKLIRAIAAGFTASASDSNAALLEASNAQALMQAYSADLKVDLETSDAPSSQLYLDQALQAFVEQVPRYYQGLPHQQNALLEAVRIWCRLDRRNETLTALKIAPPGTDEPTDFAMMNPALMRFIQGMPAAYEGYPYQREALIYLVQRWHQLDSREAAIACLQTSPSPAPNRNLLDAALIALLQRIPQTYQGKGEQRNALVEGFRLWQQLESRSAALVALGVNPDMLSASSPRQSDLTQAALQLDRALLDFIHHIPISYEGLEHQRDALMQLVQLWRGITAREPMVQFLYNDLKQMATAPRGSPEAPLPPSPMLLPAHPDRWIPTNIHVFASILPNGSFIWAEATHGGTRMPANQSVVDGIVRIAQLAEQARDRIERPLHVVNWYIPDQIDGRIGENSVTRHALGDAIVFYCNGLTGNQVYWFLDPWWTGGLGRYINNPYLIYIDARNCRIRWLR